MKLQQYELEELIKEYGSENIKDIYPTSPLQNGFIFHAINNPESDEYFVQLRFDIKGELDRKAYREAWQKTVDDYDILRTAFSWDKGEFAQIVMKQAVLDIREYDISGACDKEAEIETIRKAERQEQFDLSKPGQTRLDIIYGKETATTILNQHHILCDGWSMPILFHEVEANYEAILKGEAREKKERKQYGEYIRTIRKEKYREADEAYWSGEIQGIEEVAAVQTYKSGYRSDNNKGIKEAGAIEIELNRKESDDIKRIAKEKGITVSDFMLSAWLKLLSEYSRSDEIITGVTVSGREVPIDGIETMFGLFINTLPLRMDMSQKTAGEVLKEVHKKIRDMNEHCSIGLSEIQEMSGLKVPLVHTLYVFENYPTEENGSSAAIQMRDVEGYEKVNYALSMVAFEQGEGISVHINYDKEAFEQETIEKISGHLMQTVSGMCQTPDQPISEIQLLTEEEKEEILTVFNRTEADFPENKVYHELFRETARKYPDHIAVVFKPSGNEPNEREQSYTYRELDEITDRFAVLLREKGVGRESIVPIMVERSADIVVGAISVMKAGGAYLPIDPEYPASRIEYMLTDSGAELWITHSWLKNKIDEFFHGNMIEIDNLPELPNDRLAEDMLSEESLMTVLYTSGTTGEPKGIELTHKNIINMSYSENISNEIKQTDRVAAHASIVFDAFVMSAFSPLLTGASVYIMPEGIRKSLSEIHQYLIDNKVNITFLTTQLCEAYSDEYENEILRILLTGGEKLTKYPKRKYKIVNGYGPTEDCVYATRFEVDKDYENIPIGKPLANTKIYIVDKDNNLCPVGVPGELCISGRQLSRGYLNRPELTAEKFTANPFHKENHKDYEKMYRTGDLARWLPDGNIEFSGRVDFQVKIRGFRIEPGEIETTIVKQAGIKETVVIAKEDQAGRSYLTGYYVSGERKIGEEELREQLSKELPDYMIPQYLVELDHLPLTVNGKIDRKALPEPELHKEEYIAPRNETERKLAEIWGEVLGISSGSISIRDNYFHLGGDSIKAILTVSRAKKAGMILRPKDIFENLTIEKLAKGIDKQGTKKIKAEQGQIEGEFGLLPIQKWFFEQEFEKKNYWNQSVLIIPDEKADKKKLEESAEKLILRQDTLRLRYRKDEGGWKQRYSFEKSHRKIEIKEADISKNKDQEAAIGRLGTKWQSGFDIEKGDVMSIGIIRGHKDGKDRIHMAIHHLMVDGVSWRIILRELECLYKGRETGEKTSSFKDWEEALRKYGQREKVRKTLTYWKQSEEALRQMKKPVLRDGYSKKEESINIVTVKLDKENTEKLLHKSNQAYNTQINDLLLTAFAGSICRWGGAKESVINLEGHGREDIDEEIDLSNTVGWFTIQYPLRLKTDGTKEIGDRIKSIKEQNRKVPDKGISYGVLRYLSDAKNELCENCWVSFNYLGDFKNAEDKTKEAGWSLGFEESGESTDRRNHNGGYLLNVNGWETKDGIEFSLAYSEAYFDRKEIEEIGGEFRSQLEEIVLHCTEKKETEKTVGDYGFTKLEQSELEELIKEYGSENIKDIYPTSPLQNGFIFHAINNPESDEYFVQLRFDIKGELDRKAYREAWQKTVDDYDILRTAFSWDKGEFAQIVMKQAVLDIREYDISGAYDKEAEIETIRKAERQEQFDLSKPGQTRLDIIYGKETATTILNQHHILCDGWSMPILFHEVEANYEAILKGEAREKKERKQYGEYIRTLRKEKYREVDEAYWSREIQGIEEVAAVQTYKSGYRADNNKGIKETGAIEIELNRKESDDIKRIAKEKGITVSDFMLSAWLKLLSEYSRSDEIITGVTVSGREVPIDGIETMFGLFINTLPFRMDMSQKTAGEVLKEVHKKIRDMNEHCSIGLSEIQEMSGLKVPLVHTLYVFENYPIEENGSSAAIQMRDVEGYEKVNYALSMAAFEQGEGIFVHINYDKEAFEQETIEKISGHLMQTVSGMCQTPDQPISEIQLLTEEEKEEILTVFNRTEADFPEHKVYHELFRETARKYPDHIAVVFKPSGNEPNEREQSYTYRELDEITDRFAVLLREKGVGRESIVPIMVERSADIVVGAISVMKAGGAWFVIDPEYPKERKHFQLEDSSARLVLTQQKNKDSIEEFGIGTILLDERPPALTHSLKNRNKENDTAVIVYTSGSTGKPKGSLLTHANIANFCYWEQKEYGILQTDKSAEYAAFTFDISMHTLLSHLLGGASIHIIPEQTRFSLAELETYINENQITLLTLPTQVCEEYMTQCNTPKLKRLTVAGEKLKIYKERNYELINAYGPSEYTIYTTHRKVSEFKENIPIGKPLANTKIYIVDKDNNLCPVGVPGELCISGRQLSRGYLNRPELTAEKFTANPFHKENHKDYEKMYRTGDLARWLPDGNIEFSGRVDFQVKIRGFRIEPGEIETAIVKQAGIKETVVIAKEDQAGRSYLTGYYVSGERKIGEEELREQLSKELPDYMIPQYLVELDHLPLTVNGKIDRKALPEPELHKEEYIAPRNETERKLAEIWGEVLGISSGSISIRDNYFHLGGDSIKAIQTVSRAKKAGIILRTKDIFENLTIEKLAKGIDKQGTKKIKAEQGQTEGEFGLLPIQKWFFEQEFEKKNYWNQSVLIIPDEKADKKKLEESAEKLILRQDTLRLRYRKDEGGWKQKYSFEKSHRKIEIKEADISKNKDQEAAIGRLGTKWQSGFDIEKGDVMSIGIIRGHKDGKDRIHMAIHHLMVDGVSWRIILRELECLYKGRETGEKTSSFKDWEEALRYGQREKVRKTLTYWKQSEEALRQMKKPVLRDGYSKEESINIVTVKLDKENTEKLLHKSNQAYNTQINDLLLTAFAGSICRWGGAKESVINLEGHGREDIDEEIDLSNTVGWFTIQYPLRLKTDGTKEIGDRIKSIKEQNRKVPDKGISYGVLRYLSDAKNELCENCWVSFNYLGDFKNAEDKTKEAGWNLGFEGSGESTDRRNHNGGYLLNVNGWETKDGIEFSLAYSEAYFDRKEIEEIGGEFRSQLEEIVLHCTEKKETEKTVSDYGFTKLEQSELEELIKEYGNENIKDIYPTSPLQNGFIFHAINNPESDEYFIQRRFDIKGELDRKAYREAWQKTVDDYDILRTAFSWDKGEFAQIVMKQAVLDIREYDISGACDKEAEIETIRKAERQEQFDLSKPGQTRLDIIYGKETATTILNQHHILCDGWSMPILFHEVEANYEAILKGEAREKKERKQYGEYIRTIRKEKYREADEAYWSREIQSIEEVAAVQTYKSGYRADNNKGIKEAGAIEIELNRKESDDIKRIAKEKGITVSDFMLSAWLKLLSEYSRSDEIITGVTVSGREVPIDGIETMFGLFINTLPLRMDMSQKTAGEVLKEVHKKIRDMNEHCSIGLSEIQEMSGLKVPLVHTLYVFENYPIEENGSSAAIQMRDVEGYEKVNYALSMAAFEQGEGISVHINYDKEAFEKETIEKISGHLMQTVSGMCQTPDQPISEIQLLTEEEKEEILTVFNRTEADFPEHKVYHELFRETARKYPDHIAVVFKPSGNEPNEREQSYTYRELDEITDRFAALLREKGVGRESIVPIMVERSADIVVGAISVMKAGGAWFVIDPEYPKERKHFQLEDSSARLVLTQQKNKDSIEEFGIGTILLDERPPALTHSLKNRNKENDTAVIVYTSGSTGKPKGSLLTHANIANFCYWEQKEYGILQTDKSAEYAAFTFDISMHTLLSHLLGGASIHIIPEQTRFSLAELETYINENQITLLTLPTQVCEEYMTQCNTPKLKRLTVAGEKLKIYKERNYELINAYGPSEYTIYTTHRKVSEFKENIPIGKPLANTKIYIVDKDNNLCPVGVPGELCISGRQLSRGYLNRPELTAEKFTANPFHKENHKDYEKMYRTGDLARWLPDGNIEFSGRVDFQVKIRGFRIEPGEIETAIVKQAGIKETVVIAKEDQAGRSYLTGYYVSGERKIGEEELREQLSKELPDYMIPQYLVELDHLPLTVNGKIDRKALPEPELHKEEYIAPRNETERKLAEIWGEVLGISSGSISIRDNYFHLGGDSIKAIQTVSRAKKAGIILRTKDIFENLTIEKLAKGIDKQGTKKIKAEQGQTEGEFGLLPIQKWFFEQEFEKKNYWNQSVLIIPDEKADKKKLEESAEKLILRQDTLRLRYRKDEGGWKQKYSFEKSHRKIEIKEADISKNKDQEAAIGRLGTKWQSGFDIEKGDVMSIGIIRGHKDGKDRIHMAIHHLMVDGVSWRIILRELECLYKGRETGEKTSSFKDWEEALRKYGQREKVRKTLTYWKQSEEALRQMKKPVLRDGYSKEESINIVTVKLDKENTEKLLHKSNQAYNTQINDLLLTAFAGSICRWGGAKESVINLEGHGREDIDEEIDLSNTVGWFTIQYPLRLKTDGTKEIGDRIKSIKEQNRKIPDKGISYGVLRYLSDAKNELCENCWVSFNYLGDFKNAEDKTKEAGWSLGFEGSGESTDRRNHNGGYLLNVNGWETKDGIEFSLAYSEAYFDRKEIEEIGGEFRSQLEEIVLHCTEKKETEKTVGDYGFTKLEQSELEELIKEYGSENIKDIYPTSPLQNGFIFHAINNPESDEYFIQRRFDIKGELDRKAYREAWQKTVDDYDILRTAFSWDKGEFAQIVMKQAVLDIREYDISGACDKEAEIETIRKAERQEQFDLSKPGQTRLDIIYGKEAATTILNQHHILCDGWSMPILFHEVEANYEAILKGEAREKKERKQYGEYIRTIRKEKYREADEAYWSREIQGIEEVAAVQAYKSGYRADNNKGIKEAGAIEIELNRKESDDIKRIAKEKGITVSDFMLSAWLKLLSEYSRSDEIITGVTVSGREVPIDGIETMFGLFINTLPLRMDMSQKTAEEVLKEVHKKIRDMNEHCSIGLSEIQEMSGLKVPLVHTLYVFENYPTEENGSSAAIQMRDVEGYEKVNYALSMAAFEQGEGISVHINYDKEAFEQETIEKISGHLMQTVSGMCQTPDQPISEIQLLTEEEKEEILRVFNRTEADFPEHKVYHELFRETARKYPDHIAVVFKPSGNEPNEREQSYTYRELDEITDRFAVLLRKKGVGRESIVPIMVERSADIVVGAISVMKAGGAYLPIDPEYPASRIEYMLTDSGAKVLLAQPWLLDQIECFKGEVLDITVIPKSLDQSVPENINMQDDLCYVIYTSGSTGMPKGVMIEHKGLINLACDQQMALHITHNSKFCEYASFSFDTSVYTLFLPLLNGAMVHILNQEERYDLTKMVQSITENKIEILNLPTQLGTQFYEQYSNANLRYLITGGEALKVRKEEQQYELVNEYGPTEYTVSSTRYLLKEDIKNIPIGKPISNTKIYVVDKNNRLCPVGVPGELCISGRQISRGYLNRPELTAEKFTTNPFHKENYKDYEKMYRTGDLARWLPDGNIEFLGRMDFQVKIRGFRIELGEIETAILKQAGIKETVVAAKEDQTGSKYLVGYYVSGETKIGEEELREQLSKVLPEYMVPQYLVELDRLPLTVNGKIDRKALPEPELHKEEYIAPRNETERKLAGIWGEVLGISSESISIRDNYFHLGGNSIKVINLSAKIRKELGADIKVAQLFKLNTIEEQAKAMKMGQSIAQKTIHFERAEKKESYPAGNAQKRIYLANKLRDNDTGYNIPQIYKFTGNLDAEKLRTALQQLVDTQMSLRTFFEQRDGEIRQKILDCVEITLEEKCIRQEETDEAIKQFIRPFDLEKGPLWRVALYHLQQKKEWLLLLDFHHSIFDGQSIEIFMSNLRNGYEGKQIIEPEIQYIDYAEWEAEYIQSEEYKEQGRYWDKELSGELPVLELPLDHRRKSKRSYEAGTKTIGLKKEVMTGIQKIAETEGTTAFVVMLAAYDILLSRYARQEDLIVGIPTLGRAYADLEETIGMFVGTLPIRTVIKGEKTIAEYITEVKEKVLNGLSNQEYPLEEMIANASIQRTSGHNALFDVMFAIWEQTQEEMTLGEANCELNNLGEIKAKYDLTFYIEIGMDSFVSVEYAKELFEEETIERMLVHYESILNQMIEKTERPISEIQLLTEEEKKEILTVFNRTEADFPENKVYHELFRETARKYPDHIAVVFKPSGNEPNEREQSYTYRELDEITDRFAALLREKGVGRESIVPIMVERSADIVVGAISVMKAGGAYLPIDPEYPASRIEYMLTDSGAKVVFMQPWLLDRISGFKGELLDITAPESLNESIPENINAQDDLCYVIYTSGSTGNPKGVMIEHKGLINLCFYQQKGRQISEESYVAEYFNFAFDGSIFSIFPALAIGGTVQILSVDEQKDIEKLIGAIEKSTVVHLPTPVYESLSEQQIAKLSNVEILVAGEKLSKNEGNVYNLINAYGPTESTVEATDYAVMGSEANIPIGKPIANTKIYIVDKDNNLCPVGVPGELCISGRQLSRGYLNQPELTAEKFTANPFHTENHKDYEKMYRTGDLARWLPDGNIEFSGRIDFQVKIRGFRIELGEIETAIVKQAGIKETVVIAKEDQDGRSYLTGYYVSGKTKIGEEDLRDHLAKKLPDYMIPQYLVELDRLPLTVNGKIDRKALPEPELHKEEYIAPRNETERKLAEIWGEVLGISSGSISIKDNYFHLGGNSIKAIQMVSRAKKEGMKIQTKGIFENVTIEKLARTVENYENKLILKNFDNDEKELEYYNVRFPKHNKSIPSCSSIIYENILAFGATGFLGIHILNKMLELTNANFTCIIRGNSHIYAAQKMKEYWNYYFKEAYPEKRIQVYAGDITKADFGLTGKELEKIGTSCDAILNSAANVRFFKEYDEVKAVNVDGVRNISEFALKYDMPLHHISTLSIAGSFDEERGTNLIFTENDLYIRQYYASSNYVSSKFIAEQKIIDYMEKGLKANIYRVGRLTGRYSDGMFQKNMEENYYYNYLRFLLKVGITTKAQIEETLDMTPVDYCARLIVNLMIYGVLCRAFHVSNTNEIKLEKMVKYFQNEGYTIEVLDLDEFKFRMDNLISKNQEPELLMAVINEYDNKNSFGVEQQSIEKIIDVKSDITMQYCKKIGFKWPKVNQKYINMIIKNMRERSFI